jgi:hypothetical protein
MELFGKLLRKDLVLLLLSRNVLIPFLERLQVVSETRQYHSEFEGRSLYSSHLNPTTSLEDCVAKFDAFFDFEFLPFLSSPTLHIRYSENSLAPTFHQFQEIRSQK